MNSRGPSKHLLWSELACKDGTPYPHEWRATRGRELGIVFERIRSAAGNRPITVGSAYRTPSHNRAVGGGRDSQHLHGRAMDLYTPKGMSRWAFHDLVRRVADEMVDEGLDLIGGIGYYPWGCHVDTRGGIGDRLIVWWGNKEIEQ